MNAVAENMANAETTETPEGGPYRRKRVVVSEDPVRTSFKEELTQARAGLSRTNSRHLSGFALPGAQGVEVPTADMKITEQADNSFRLVYDPSHPDANSDGYVKMPNVDVITEMVDMVAASRGYEANTSAIAAAKKMAKSALDI